MGTRLPKKQRQSEEGVEAQWEGRSLKDVTSDANYRNVSKQTLPTTPQTNPYICHKSRQMYTSYPYTSHMLGADP